MKRNKFFLQLSLILMAGVVFSGCLKSPDKGDPGAKLFQASDGSGRPVVAQTSPEDVSKFEKPFAEGVANTQSDLLAIRDGLAKGFDLGSDEVQITIEGESSTNYATGYVNVGEGEKGGIYFATRQDGEWLIAYNGIGTLTCDMIEGYNFPAGLIPKCYDMDSGMMMER